MHQYKIGYYYEVKVLKYLKRLGYDVWRSPGSHSPIDVIAIHPITKKILLIQVKATSKDEFSFNSLSREERGKLLELVQRYRNYPEVNIQLWVFFRKTRTKKVFDLKTLF